MIGVVGGVIFGVDVGYEFVSLLIVVPLLLCCGRCRAVRSIGIELIDFGRNSTREINNNIIDNIVARRFNLLWLWCDDGDILRAKVRIVSSSFDASLLGRPIGRLQGRDDISGNSHSWHLARDVRVR